jgi:hypothetical protein
MPALGQKQTDALKSRCPLYPRKQTLLSARWMSALCQKQTFDRLFDHLAGGRKDRGRQG